MSRSNTQSWLHRALRAVWPTEAGATRAQVLRRARTEIRTMIRSFDGALRLPAMRVWISADQLPPDAARAIEVEVLGQVLTEYASDVARERGLPDAGRVEVRTLDTVPGRVEAQALRPAVRFTTELLPRRMDSADVVPTNARHAVFEILRGAPAGTLVVDAGAILGRLPCPDGVVVPSARVSGRHARVTMTDGALTITDLGSRNGSFVGGARLAPHVSTALPLRGVLRLADVELRLVDLR